jgi:uncharacterized protein YeaO (DUF488 family)
VYDRRKEADVGMTARERGGRLRTRGIVVKRVYERPSSDDGLRVLVDGLWPRGIAKAALKYDAWPRALAPSNELRKWYGHNRSRAAEFRRRYRKELASHHDELAALRAMIGGRPVTLLTATRELELSHALVLRDVLSGVQPRKRVAEV